MARTAIDTLARSLDWAYRSDPFHALRRNVESVRPDEWDVTPARWTVDEFGTQPELSISDLIRHVGGAKYMYANRTFGDETLEWTDIQPPPGDMPSMLDWLEAGHQELVRGLAALGDDTELVTPRSFPGGLSFPREGLLRVVINHDLYHAGEINRQRALLRGADGWDR